MAAGPDRRAGTLTALASVTAVAVVVAGGLVGWMRMAPGAADRAPVALTEEVPEEFDGGFAPAPVPDAVAAAVDGPVVGAVALDSPPDGVDLCGLDGAGGDRELVWALVTPEGLQIAYIFDEPPWMDEDMIAAERGAPRPVPVEATAVPLDDPVPAPRAVPEPEPAEPAARHFESCGARWERETWSVVGGMGMTLPPGGPLPADSAIGSSCCDREGFATVSATIVPVDGAAWLLQDRGGYWLAYPAEGFDVVPLTWRHRQGRFGPGRTPSSHVLSVDADGTVLDDRYVGG